MPEAKCWCGCSKTRAGAIADIAEYEGVDLPDALAIYNERERRAKKGTQNGWG